MITVEIYYGFYLGDSKVWDTVYVDVEENSKDIEGDALKKFQEDLPSKGDLDISFFGIYSIDYDRDEDEG